MGGIGGKGKGARRRQKLKENAKVFDKKTGSFREPKIELIDGQVSREELLKAPSSFRRFMEATRRAKEQRDRRDERARVARGSEDHARRVVMRDLDAPHPRAQRRLELVAAGTREARRRGDEREDVVAEPLSIPTVGPYHTRT